jgi:diguanylate cyclase (GGDEF)-like protein
MRKDWPSAEERRRILWPSIAAAWLPFALLSLPPSRWNPGEVVVAGALTLAIAVVAMAVPSRSLPKRAPCAIAFTYLLVILVLRDAGGPSGVAPLMLLPVFWLSLYGSRRELWCLLIAVALVVFVPLLAERSNPSGAWRAGVLFLVASGIIGTTLQALVARVREHERERDRLVTQLADLAHTDSLTGVPNRRGWEIELERGLARARRVGEPMSVALVDIDGFKAINDVHGHPGGDRLLVAIAQRWSKALRPDDVLARIGGDEFAVLLPACTESESLDVLERLRAGTPTPYSCSVGVATWDGGELADDLRRRADDSLYGAKRGRQSPPAGAALTRQ